MAAAETEKRSRVLFLCTHNSARSQMAEGLLRHLAGERFEAHSAGTEATLVRPLAIRAMEEIDIDISGQESKTLDGYLDQPFDYVITVCDDANEACPVFPGARNRLHWSFEDPSQAEGSEDERLAVFRRVRDEIRVRIERELVKLRSSPELPRIPLPRRWVNKGMNKSRGCFRAQVGGLLRPTSWCSFSVRGPHRYGGEAALGTSPGA